MTLRPGWRLPGNAQTQKGRAFSRFAEKRKCSSRNSYVVLRHKPPLKEVGYFSGYFHVKLLPLIIGADNFNPIELRNECAIAGPVALGCSFHNGDVDPRLTICRSKTDGVSASELRLPFQKSDQQSRVA